VVNRGEVLGGRYAVERVLGQGGMGVVVAARHIELRQRVAIKMLLASEHQDAELLRRFERESRSVAELSSEHVARVTDIGTFEDGSPFMVMEYLEGEDLQARIDRDGPLPIALAVRLFAQAAIGLGDAHEHHVIHRDVKPSNLFLTRRRSGRIVLKVLDFGIAKADDEPLEASMTSISSLIGSPQYMSPEQLCDPRAVDPRTDIWSLGASFYEAISGCAAFPADSLPELHMKVLAFEPPRLSSLRPDCPPDLDRIVQRCLAKEASQRFASMSELQHALEDLEATGLADALPPDSSPLVTASNVPVVTLPGMPASRRQMSVPPPSVRAGSPLPAPPRALGAARPLTSTLSMRDAGPPPRANDQASPSVEARLEVSGDAAPPRAPSAAPSALRVTLVSATVAALVSSVTTFALTRARAFESSVAPVTHASSAPYEASPLAVPPAPPAPTSPSAPEGIPTDPAVATRVEPSANETLATAAAPPVDAGTQTTSAYTTKGKKATPRPRHAAPAATAR
jgi:serine/threonine protein kinase